MAVYSIRVKGHLDPRWSEWFDGLTITNLTSGVSELSGDIVDQAELHGILTRIRNLNVPLLSVTDVDSTDIAPQEYGSRIDDRVE